VLWLPPLPCMRSTHLHAFRPLVGHDAARLFHEQLRFLTQRSKIGSSCESCKSPSPIPSVAQSFRLSHCQLLISWTDARFGDHGSSQFDCADVLDNGLALLVRGREEHALAVRL
jgi:hypothetical protein